MSSLPTRPVQSPGTQPVVVPPERACVVAKQPRGPKGLAKFVTLLRMARDPLTTSVRLFDKYGDLVRLADDALLTRDANLLEEIAKDYLTFAKNFSQTYGEAASTFWGNSMAIRSDPDWLRQRRLMQPALLPGRIAVYANAMVADTSRMLDTWRDGEVFDLHVRLKRLTLESMIKNLFGVEFSADQMEQVIAALEAVMTLFDDLSQMELKFDTPDKARFRETLKRLDELVYAALAKRRSEPEDRGDMLSAWMAAKDESGKGFTDVELRDELVTHLRAGYRNTATVLCWAFVLLHRNPGADARLAAELQDVLRAQPPHLGALPRLVYADQVIKETMRLYPLYPMLGRTATRACNLGGYELAAGTGIGISVWAMHRDPRYFDEPEAFDPDRWTEALEARLPKHAFFPFGGGPRQCPFKSYGQLESVLMLATIAQRFHVTLAQGEGAALYPSVNGLLPKDGLKVVVARRTA